MIKIRDECVGCPPEMGCLGSSCPYMNVEIRVCDKCGDNADYNLDGDDFCKRCAEDYLTECFRELDITEKAEALEIELEKLNK